MKELKIFLDNHKGNILRKANKLQELFGGDSERKPNFFGYFFRVGICPETKNIFVRTNRFDCEKDLRETVASKLALIKQQP